MCFALFLFVTCLGWNFNAIAATAAAAEEEVSLGDDVTSGEKAPLGRILRNFRLLMRTPLPSPSGDLLSLWVKFHNVTSGQKVPLRILRNSDCACAHTREPLRMTFGHYGWRFITSLPFMRSDSFCTTIIVVVHNVMVAHALAITSGELHFRSRDWRHFWWRHFR